MMALLDVSVSGADMVLLWVMREEWIRLWSCHAAVTAGRRRSNVSVCMTN
jgi:hypothetical protein